MKNREKITLFKEGIFYRAYEGSAFLFVKHIKAYSITKKFYKNVKKEVVHLGFPQNSFSNIENICTENKFTVETGEKQICISGFEPFNQSDYDFWKRGIKQIVAQNKFQGNSIIEKLRSFPVISKSPLECQQFLFEIQNELNGQLH